jgi:hypothetical protein
MFGNDEFPPFPNKTHHIYGWGNRQKIPELTKWEVFFGKA